MRVSKLDSSVAEGHGGANIGAGRFVARLAEMSGFFVSVTFS